MTSAAAQLTVARNLPIDVRQRQIYVSVDGQAWATLVFGQTVTRELAPGVHTIRANNTLVWKTLKFEAQPGEHVEFDLANRPPRGFIGVMALLGVGPLMMTFERKTSQPS